LEEKIENTGFREKIFHFFRRSNKETTQEEAKKEEKPTNSLEVE